ncbi:MAG: hypothetical protein FWE63_03895 [Bacteroidales bacterium]|nr:hypothetical protein [Bacteroidales bacterium]
MANNRNVDKTKDSNYFEKGLTSTTPPSSLIQPSNNSDKNPSGGQPSNNSSDTSKMK